MLVEEAKHMFKQNMTNCMLYSLFLIMFISLRNRNMTFANILTCFNGQELIKDESGNVVDWTNKNTDINKTNHSPQVLKGGTHFTYIVNKGDEATWEIGPDGYPMPLEEFKIREVVNIKEGVSILPKAKELINILQSGWTIVYKVGDQYYKINGSDLPGRGRTVCSFNDKELLTATEKDISSNEQLLAMAIKEQGKEDNIKTIDEKRIIYSGYK